MRRRLALLIAVVAALVAATELPFAFSEQLDRLRLERTTPRLERELAGAHAVDLDRQVMIEARRIIEPDETFAVVTGDREAVSNDVVLDSVAPFARFWLMPRREVPLAEADWVICYGCDRGPAGIQLQPGALGFPEHVLYIGRPVR